MPNKTTIKKGLYMTWYGNTAFVSGTGAKSAWDLDMGERIPISQVDLHKFIRACKDKRG